MKMVIFLQNVYYGLKSMMYLGETPILRPWENTLFPAFWGCLPTNRTLVVGWELCGYLVANLLFQNKKI